MSETSRNSDSEVSLTYNGVRFESNYYHWVTANKDDLFSSAKPSAFIKIENSGAILTKSFSLKPDFTPLLTPVSLNVEVVRSSSKNSYVTQNSTIYSGIKIDPILVVIQSGPNLGLYSELFQALEKQTGNNFKLTVEEDTIGSEGSPTKQEIFEEAMVLKIKQKEAEMLILFDFVKVSGFSKSFGSQTDQQGKNAYSYDKRMGMPK